MNAWVGDGETLMYNAIKIHNIMFRRVSGISIKISEICSCFVLALLIQF